MCIGLKYSANTRRLLVLARTHSALKNLPSITTSQYTAERRDVLENTPPEDREICRSRDFAPRGQPEGNLEGVY